jgi:hypothetical protein
LKIKIKKVARGFGKRITDISYKLVAGKDDRENKVKIKVLDMIIIIFKFKSFFKSYKKIYLLNVNFISFCNINKEKIQSLNKILFNI